MQTHSTHVGQLQGLTQISYSSEKTCSSQVSLGLQGGHSINLFELFSVQVTVHQLAQLSCGWDGDEKEVSLLPLHNPTQPVCVQGAVSGSFSTTARPGCPSAQTVSTNFDEHGTSSSWQFLGTDFSNSTDRDASDQMLPVPASLAAISGSPLWSFSCPGARPTRLGFTSAVVGCTCNQDSRSVAIWERSICPVCEMPVPLATPINSLQSSTQQSGSTGVEHAVGAQPTSCSCDYGCELTPQQLFSGIPRVWPSTLQLVLQSSSQEARRQPSLQATLRLAGATGAVAGASSTTAIPASVLPGLWDALSLVEALPLLWSSQQVQQARGGRLSHTECRTAWHAAGETQLCSQDLYIFCKLKHVLHKLDVAHKMRVRLVKRLHAVVDFGSCDLKSVYFEVRCIINEVLLASVAGGSKGVRMTGLARLALALQEALALGPTANAPVS